MLLKRAGSGPGTAKCLALIGLAPLLLAIACTPAGSTPGPPAASSAPPTTPTATVPAAASLTPDPTADVTSPAPSGRVVFTCQPSRRSDLNQICMIEADGSNEQQLTNYALADHLYPSLSVEGESVVFSSNRSGGYDLYEQPSEPGSPAVRLTSSGDAYAPEISPDGLLIAFTRSTGAWRQLWLMDRSGSNPRPLTDPAWGGAWDPSWSPDGAEILFASDHTGEVQLFTLELQTRRITQRTAVQGLRGRNDWSPGGDKFSTYAGVPWARELIEIDLLTGSVEYLTTGGNNLAPSYSPDGLWSAFTSYRDNFGDEDGCEIYIMNLNSREIRRLTENDYCDWQPRWGR